MTFDGKALWVGLSNSPTALRINVSAPRDLLATLPVALPFPSTASVFDGKNVWFLHAAGNSITKLPAYP
jgi:hypothetical protein